MGRLLLFFVKNIKAKTLWIVLGNVFSDTLVEQSNILMNPINAFVNKTEQLLSPLRQVLSSNQKMLVYTCIYSSSQLALITKTQKYILYVGMEDLFWN